MSDKMKQKKIKMTEGKKICSVGGQALMEGIMMLGPHGMAQVVRNPEGELVIKKEKVTPVMPIAQQNVSSAFQLFTKVLHSGYH